MSRKKQAKHRRIATVNAAVPLSSITPGTEYYDWLTGGQKSAGMVVNESTVMCVSAVFACIQLIAGAIASLPLNIYQRKGISGDRDQMDHPLWWLFNEEPHPTLTAAVFWEYIITSKLLHGDGFARIHRVSKYSPEIKWLEPLHPFAIYPVRNGDRLNYYLAATNEMLDQDDILHFPGIGFNASNAGNGYLVPRSLSPLRHALKLSAGIALAADNYTSQFYSEGSKPEFVLKTTNTKLDNTQKVLLQDAWRDIQQGNRFKPGVLGSGVELQELTMNAEESQLLGQRQFQVEDIARIFGVPPFMVGHTQNTTSWGSGVENMGIGFKKYTLMRDLNKIRQEVNRKCFRNPSIFCEHDTSELERGDTKGRYDGFRVALGRAGEPGFMTVNEVRKTLNLPPVLGGDILLKGTQDAPAA